jgi:hypothetical protein
MPDRSRADLVRACFAAYQAKDRTTMERLLAGAFRFTSPYDDRIDKATYFERCWPMPASINTFIVERIFVEADAAFVTYQFLTDGGKQVRNTEYFTFAGDEVTSIDVYFGASYQDGVFVRQAGQAGQAGQK